MCRSFTKFLIVVSFTTLFSGIALSQEQKAEETPLPPGITGVEASAVPTRDAVWAVFVQTIGAEDAGLVDGERSLKDRGYDSASAYALSQHMRASVLATRRSDEERRRELCARKDQIKTRDDLVREYNALTKAGDDERQRFVDEVTNIVDAGGKTKLSDEAEKMRSTMGSLNIDAAVYFATQPDSIVEKAMNNVCNSTRPRAPVQSRSR